MRIILVTDGLTPWVTGGMQRHSFLLAKFLTLAGIEVDLISMKSQHNETEADVLGAFPEESQPKLHISLLPFEDKARFPGHYIWASFKFSQQVYSVIESRPKADFIYTKGFTGWQLLRKKRIHNFPPVGVKFHGMNMFQKQSNWKAEIEKYLFRWPVRWIMRHSDVVFSYGGKITEIIKEQMRSDAKIVEMPSGIGMEWIRNQSEISESHNKLRFLFVGRNDRVKGLPELYKAIAEVSSADKWSLSLVGPIPEEYQFEHPNLVYLGPIFKDESLLEIYDRHEILVCPSISEGMPNVIMEAMSRGLAVIATDVGATQVLVDCENGWLIPPGNVQALIAAMNAAIDAPSQKLKDMRILGIIRMRENFVWEEISARFRDWLSAFVKEKN